MSRSFLVDLKEAQRRVNNTKEALIQLGYQVALSTDRDASPTNTTFVENDVYSSLLKVSKPLGDSYAQLKKDIEDGSRLTWAGAAHELREVLRCLLELLAPDDKVMAASWYQEDRQKKSPGPSHKQRALYILKQRNAGSTEQDVIKQIEVLEEGISNIIRLTYTRMSNAAHDRKGRREAKKLLAYFDAFAHDLLDLE